MTRTLALHELGITFVVAAISWCSGCSRTLESDVVLYSTVEQELAMPILTAFERSTDDVVGITSRFRSDPAEHSLLTSKIASADLDPPCDVIWNSGVLQTVRLQQRGLLKPRSWDAKHTWPMGGVSTDGTWFGFAAVARVLLVNTRMLENPDDYPTSVLDLANEKWAGQCAVANPTLGTTLTHFAILQHQLGKDAAAKIFEKIQTHAKMLPGNQQVAISVASGQVAWGLTDSDHAIVEADRNPSLRIVFPDQGSSEAGTLLIPNTVAVLKSAQHPVAAGLLADYLVSPLTEDRLAMGNTSQIPLNQESKFPSKVLDGKNVRWMNANFEAAAMDVDNLHQFLQSTFGDDFVDTVE